MKATAQLQELGQSLWLDNITREMLDSGQLQRYIDEFSITGLTSNPSIFDKAIKSGAYDDEIRHKAAAAADRETLFFELAIEDLRRAADLFAPIHQRTAGVDGWVSLEVSPLLAYDTARSVRAAADLHARAGRENVFIKIPGTERGLAAIEEATFAGVPVNVTLLFSREQYLASADAYMRGIERRIEAGLDPNVPSVASVFISRWDAAVIGRVPDHLRDRLGLAVGLKTYQAYRRLMDSDRWQRLANAGARTQRLLWASTSTKDPDSPDTMYIDGLRAPHTINTMPESTLQRLRGPWPGGQADRGRRRRCRGHAGPVRIRGHRRRRAGRDAPVGRSPELRQIVGGPVEPDRRPGRGGGGVTTLSERRCWQALSRHHEDVKDLHLRELFAADPARGERLVGRGRRPVPRLLQEPDHRRDAASCWCALAEQSGLPDRIEAMFAGERINVSENRSVLHVALRMPQERVADRRRRRRGRAGARGARPDGGVRRPGALAASGRATPASRSATWSTSASAARTSGR